MMATDDTAMKDKMGYLLDIIDEGEKKEKLIEIMKMKIFNEKKVEGPLYLSNSWGYGISSRPFIGI